MNLSYRLSRLFPFRQEIVKFQSSRNHAALDGFYTFTVRLSGKTHGGGMLRLGAAFAVFWTSCSLSSRNSVVVVPVISSAYADAAAPGAIQRVCAEAEEDLPPYFHARGAPYSAHTR
jgi:cytochrome c biogenesis protein CcdA